MVVVVGRGEGGGVKRERESVCVSNFDSIKSVYWYYNIIPF